MKKFVVLGNPIKHSKSPLIHKIFAKQFKIKNFYYEKILVPLKKFSFVVDDFFSHGGYGANITAPFKQEAFSIVNKITDRAKLSRSVNTLKYINGYLLGDNTDGIGLLQDLKRLNMIDLNDKVLIIGAGGAAYGIVYTLLLFGYNLTICNRTLKRAIDLQNFYSKKIKVLEFNEINNNHKFNLIINTSSKHILEKFILPEKLFIDKYTKCYDINYHDCGKTPFLMWCKKRQVNILNDGLGMLVCQAAHSFLFWNECFPDCDNVIKYLKKELSLNN